MLKEYSYTYAPVNINSYFFLTVKVSRGTDYDEGYVMINQQTQTEVTCKCFKKGNVSGATWDDGVDEIKSLEYKKNEVLQRGRLVEFKNRIHIPMRKDRERIR